MSAKASGGQNMRLEKITHAGKVAANYIAARTGFANVSAVFDAITISAETVE